SQPICLHLTPLRRIFRQISRRSPLGIRPKPSNLAGLGVRRVTPRSPSPWLPPVHKSYESTHTSRRCRRRRRAVTSAAAAVSADGRARRRAERLPPPRRPDGLVAVRPG